MAALKRGSQGLTCPRVLKELELQSLSQGKTLSERRRELCSPAAPLPGEEGMGRAVQPGRSCFQRLHSPLSSSSSRGTRIPSCSTWIQEVGAKLGCLCSKRCPGSIQSHLALPRGCALLQPHRNYPSQREKDPNSPSGAAWGLTPTQPGPAREGIHTAGSTKALWDKRLPKDTGATPTLTAAPSRTKLLLRAAAAPSRAAPPKAESHSPEQLCPGGTHNGTGQIHGHGHCQHTKTRNLQRERRHSLGHCAGWRKAFPKQGLRRENRQGKKAQ